MTIHAVKLKPPEKTDLAGYDFDAFAVEWDDEDPSYLDFRFELGQGLGIYWALPAGFGERLRLAHVDGAAYHVDEPTLVADPWTCELPRLEWRGALAALPGGAALVAVAVEASTMPARYRCDVTVRGADGVELVHTFAWSGAQARA